MKIETSEKKNKNKGNKTIIRNENRPIATESLKI